MSYRMHVRASIHRLEYEVRAPRARDKVHSLDVVVSRALRKVHQFYCSMYVTTIRAKWFGLLQIC